MSDVGSHYYYRFLENIKSIVNMICSVAYHPYFSLKLMIEFCPPGFELILRQILPMVEALAFCRNINLIVSSSHLYSRKGKIHMVL